MFAVDTASDTLVSENFTDYCARVSRGGRALVITSCNKPEVVMLSMEDYRSMMNREYLSKLDESNVQIERGETVRLTPEQLAAL